MRIGSSRTQSGATSTTIETGERRDDPACRQRGPFGHPATSTGADELTSLVDDPLFCHRYGQAALATEPAVSSRLAGAARCALREPVDEEVEQELFGEVLDWRNARLADGVQRALGREPRDFSEFAREAAAGVWDV
jgi:hypothetical protein